MLARQDPGPWILAQCRASPRGRRLLQFDARALGLREFRVEPDPQCPVYVPERAFNGYHDYVALCAGAY